MKKLITIIGIFFLLSTFGEAIFFHRPSDQAVEEGADLVVVGKVVQADPPPVRSLNELSRQDVMFRVMKCYRGGLQKNQLIRVRINIMDANMAVFQDAFIPRRIRGKTFLLFLYKNRGNTYKPVFGPYGFLKYDKSLRKRFTFLRSRKIYNIDKKKSFIDRIIIENN